jgi:transcriptional regulator with XRE-family HTH domain
MAMVGEQLRSWRERRHVSQLDLSLQAGISARHLSFVETGRSKPSSGLILRLSEELDVPLRERNVLLLAGGFAPAYPERGLDAPPLSAVTEAMRQVITAHMPNPALAVDGHWELIDANDAVSLLTAGTAAELMEPPVNVLRVSLHPDGMAPRILNLGQWRQHVLFRLRRQADRSGDPFLHELYEELSSYPGGGGADEAGGSVGARGVDGARGASGVRGVSGVAGARKVNGSNGARGAGEAADVVLPMRLRVGDADLSFLSTTTVFGSPLDVTVAELAIESFYPADAATAAAMSALSPMGAAAQNG